MAEQIAGWFVNNLGGVFSPELIVFIVSLLPILELRGGIIAGFLMGMELAPSFIIAFIGNIIPIPFILIFIKFIFKQLKKTGMKNFIEKLENKAISKSDKIRLLGTFVIRRYSASRYGGLDRSSYCFAFKYGCKKIIWGYCSGSCIGRNNYFCIQLRVTRNDYKIRRKKW